jgi:hypothetical protein
MDADGGVKPTKNPFPGVPQDNEVSDPVGRRSTCLAPGDPKDSVRRSPCCSPTDDAP